MALACSKALIFLAAAAAAAAALVANDDESSLVESHQQLLLLLLLLLLGFKMPEYMATNAQQNPKKNEMVDCRNLKLLVAQLLLLVPVPPLLAVAGLPIIRLAPDDDTVFLDMETIFLSIYLARS